MFVRSTIYLIIGLVAALLAGMANTRLGWSIDLVWLIVVASCFSGVGELGPIAAVICGLMLDGLSGSGGVYTVSYAGFGTLILLIRRVFYLEGLIPAWILALIGAEILWLFFVAVARAILILGGAASPPAYISPFLLSTLIGFPFVYWITAWVLGISKETARSRHYGATTRIIDRT
jgi:hypothetical protein